LKFSQQAGLFIMNCEERLFWDHKFTGSWSTCSSIPGKRFPITFYSDVPVGQGIPPWSHPGNLLYQETLDFASVNETKYGTIDHGANIIETVFQYNATLPTPFGQDASIIYWLSIQAIDDDGKPIQWGWHEAETLWHDNAVQWDKFFNGGINNWNLLTNKDMAFEIEVVTIPTTLLLLGSGLLDILGLKRRVRMS
jgi:hypothetical protein